MHSLFAQLEREFTHLVADLKGKDCLVLLTADHGLINSSEEKTLIINDYPELHDCLAQPLCGEPRVAYCYIKPDKKEFFKNQIKKHWSSYCDLYEKNELIDKGYFGFGEHSPDFLSRIGDFILMMKDNYVIKDYLDNETPFQQKAVHGGISKIEMLVPLVKVELK